LRIYGISSIFAINGRFSRIPARAPAWSPPDLQPERSSMTTQRIAGSKASARRDKAAIERWAKRQLAIARRATTRAVREHLAAGRAVVFEKNGRLYVKESVHGKARPLPASQQNVSASPEFAESEAPKYIKAPRKKAARTKSR
jgi:hypothetical protein